MFKQCGQLIRCQHVHISVTKTTAPILLTVSGCVNNLVNGLRVCVCVPTCHFYHFECHGLYAIWTGFLFPAAIVTHSQLFLLLSKLVRKVYSTPVTVAKLLR